MAVASGAAAIKEKVFMILQRMQMMKIKLRLMFFIATVLLKRTLSTTNQNQSFCALPSGERIYGQVDNCANGEVMLFSDYLRLGLHNSGSMGTQTTISTSYYSGQLGMLADVAKNGFDSSKSPAFAGDYVLASAPVEGTSIFVPEITVHLFFYTFIGWLLQYTKGGTSTTITQEGLMGSVSIIPTKYTITSNDSILSVLWIGSNADVEVRKVYAVKNNGLSFVSSVTVKSLTSQAITSVYCKHHIIYISFLQYRNAYENFAFKCRFANIGSRSRVCEIFYFQHQ